MPEDRSHPYRELQPALPSEQTRGGFWRRFVALCLDGIVVGLLGGAVGLALEAGRLSNEHFAFFSWGIGLAYFVLMEGSHAGRTLGKRALGIRVMDVHTGSAIGYPRSFIRYMTEGLSILPLGLGYLWMLWDPERQTWHDKLADSIVVRTSAYPVEPKAPATPMASSP